MARIHTQLKPNALPGQRWTLSPKGEAARPADILFTELSPNAVMGMRHAFSAKGNPHTGLFTELSLNGVMGMRHTYDPKTGAITWAHEYNSVSYTVISDIMGVPMASIAEVNNVP